MTLPTCKLCVPEGLLDRVRQRTTSNNSASSRTKDDSEEEGNQWWLVGWNPRGFVVCVADVLLCRSVAEAQDHIQSCFELNPDCPRGIRVLGRVVPAAAVENGGSPQGTAATPDPMSPEDDGSRAMKQRADIWLEIRQTERGPVLCDLFCCGLKYPPELHVIAHADQDGFRASKSHATVLSRLGGVKGVRRICDEQYPSQSSGSPKGGTGTGEGPSSFENNGFLSQLEGVMLPSHCTQYQRLLGSGSSTSATLSGRSVSPQNTTTPPLTSLFPANGSLTGQSLDGSIEQNVTPNNSFSESREHNDSISGTPSKGSYTRPPGEIEREEKEQAAAKETFSSGTCPPRLNYSTSSDRTEFAVVLESINSGYHARRYLRQSSVVGGKKKDQKAASAKQPQPKKQPPIYAPLLLPLLWMLHPLLRIAEITGRVLYTARLSELRIREAINAVSLLSGRSHSCGLHPIIPHLWEGTSSTQQHWCIGNFLLSNIVDVTLGWMMGYVMVAHKDVIFSWVSSYGYYGLHEMHLGYIDWFLGWPGGFKMNDNLNQLLGYLSTGVLHGWQWLSQWILADVPIVREMGWLSLGYNIALFSSFFGLSTLCGVIADATNVSTLHVRNLSHCFGLIYRAFLTVLSSLGKQFRGKRYNPLRKRVDDGEFMVDEVLLGTLIGTLTTFIFPTVALYYFYLTLVRTSVWVVQEGMQGVALLTTKLPVGRIVGWLLFRHRYANGVQLGRAEHYNLHGVLPGMSAGSPTSPTSRTTLQPDVVKMELIQSPMPLGDAFVEFIAVLSVVLAALRPRRLMNFIVHAKHKPKLDPRTQLYAHLVSSPINPAINLPLKVYDA